MKQPWRYELNCVAAAENDDEAEQILDGLIKMLIGFFPVVFCEGGIAERMDDKDVVPDSPLWEALGK